MLNLLKEKYDNIYHFTNGRQMDKYSIRVKMVYSRKKRHWGYKQ